MFEGWTDTEFLSRPWTVALPCLLLVVASVWLFKAPQSAQKGMQPPSIPEWLPGLGNAYQYVFHNMDFLKYVR